VAIEVKGNEDIRLSQIGKFWTLGESERCPRSVAGSHGNPAFRFQMLLGSQGYVQDDFGLLQPVMARANINNAQRSERAVPSIYNGDRSVFGR